MPRSRSLSELIQENRSINNPSTASGGTGFATSQAIGGSSDSPGRSGGGGGVARDIASSIADSMAGGGTIAKGVKGSEAGKTLASLLKLIVG